MKSTLRCILILVLILGVTPAVQATDSMYRGNPQHTGVYDATGSHPNNILKWSRDELTGSITAPTVADGVMYFGCNDHNLYALYTENGTEKWRFATGSMVYSAPAVWNGIVYFGSTDQMIYAVNVADGSLRWKVHTNSTWDSGIGMSAPVVTGGTVYIVSFDKNLYAINADTGVVRWKYPYLPVAGETGCSPAVANGVVYFGDINHAFYAVNTADGTEKWRYNGTSTTSSSPPPVPVLSDGILYAAGPGPHNITALYANTGTLKTIISRGYLTNWELTSPTIANGILYTGGTDLNLHAIDVATDADLWTFYFAACLRASPSVSDGILYAPAMNNILYALDAHNGTEIWRYSPPDNGGLWGSPVISDGVLYQDGGNRLYAIGSQQTAPRFYYGQIMNGAMGNTSAPGLGGLPVRLYGSTTSGTPGTLIDETKTNAYGHFLITVPSAQYPYFDIIYNSTIPGSASTGASSLGGSVKNATWIQFTAPIPGKNLTGNYFWETVPVVHGDFSASPLTGPAPLVVNFTDNTTGFPTLWNWVHDYNQTIDNGFITSLNANCSYNYTKPGLYSVQMRVYNAVSHDWVTRINYINVTTTPVMVPLPGFTLLPTDPDNDGLYEDLNGNGRLDFNDVVLLFKNLSWISANEPVAAFDFNRNGRIDFNDVIIRFREV